MIILNPIDFICSTKELPNKMIHGMGLHYFYNEIAMHTSLKKSIHILPPFGKLATTSIIILLVLANPDYVGYTTIKSIYDWFSDSIANILQDTDFINGQHTPQVHYIILTHSNTVDGCYLLFILLIKIGPFLSGHSLKVATEITILHVKNDDTIHLFYKRVQDIRTKLLYSCKNVDKQD